MEGMKWTNEQWEAINEENCNLLVAAAAGAGKTAVLVERIIKKITNEKQPVDIDTLLVVTFTNAAATEMRERIAQAISDVLEKNPESKLLQRQLALLGKATITTIHSFCTDVIRQNFQKLNIDPDFRIADETESSLMKLEVLDQLFEEQYEKEDNNGFFNLLESFGQNRDDQALMDIVLNLYDFVQSNPWPTDWLRNQTEKLNIPDGTGFEKTIWCKILIYSVRLELRSIKDMAENAVKTCEQTQGLEKYHAVCIEDLKNISGLLNKSESDDISWDCLYSAIQEFEIKKLPPCGKDADKEKSNLVKNLKKDIRASVKKLQEKLVNKDSEQITSDFKSLYPKIKCLSELTIAFEKNYSEKKRRKQVMDFNDLEHFCLDILAVRDEKGHLLPSETAKSYRERFSEILVDEYQDSNLVQETIIQMISGPNAQKPNVFMVGDVKQSIYRFRQARPELFMEKYNNYSDQKGSLFRKILLYKNFRSRKHIVNAVNFIFKQIMSVTAGELDYNDGEALHAGADFPEIDENMRIGENVEVNIIQTSSVSDEESNTVKQQRNEETDSQHISDISQVEEEMLDNIQCEARLVGQKIHELINPDQDNRQFYIFDKTYKTYRKIEYRDIVILLRTVQKWSQIFAEELSLMGIPVFADTGGGFFKTIEVQVVLSLLQVIDNPLQDIPLLSVLRSPIFNFSSDELAEIRLAKTDGTIYEALTELSKNQSSATSHKAGSFLKQLEEWRELSLYMPVDELIWKLYKDTGYYNMAGAMPSGEQRQANLRILFERARQFEETSYKGLFNFINFVDRLKSSGDMSSASVLSENENVVRIMSIHKSKGLEFPVVFLSGCGKRFNFQDMNKNILLHQDLGFGPDVVDLKLRLSWPSAAKLAIREKIKAETLSEEMRILYVAMTRAKEKLIITGSVPDYHKAGSRWLLLSGSQKPKLPDYEVIKAKNYFDWICPALLRHRQCHNLREIAKASGSFKESYIEDQSCWSVNFYNKNDIIAGKSIEEENEKDFINWIESLCLPTKGEPTEIQKEIDRRLSWDYPYKMASKIPAKISVSEIKSRFYEKLAETGSAQLPAYIPDLKKPGFLQEKTGLSAAEKGTILHFAMQHLKLKPISLSIMEGRLENEIELQIERMVKKDLLTVNQAKTINIEKISGFFNSELGRRMLNSHEIHREVRFNVEIPCRDIQMYFNIEQKDCIDEMILLQGVIDCFFDEPGGIVLIDYKTDYVLPWDEGKLEEKYKIQIHYYARALELLTGKKVNDRYIYFFSIDKYIKVKPA
jgi:ATP-dependent helicase/nuclease subunit A